MSDQTPQGGREAGLARARRILDANPELTAIGLYAAVTIAATIVAYFTIFTTFAPYDDEGTVLIGLRAFVEGDVLYRDVWSVYGPFYYELFGGFFSLFGLDVTTDASRTVVIGVWVGTSFLFGLAAHRLTRNLWLGLTGMIAAFAALGVLVFEPMHPHGLSILLLGGFVLLATVGPGRRTAWVGAGAGALLAALLLTKVNLGGFAIAATVVACGFAVAPFARWNWLRWLLGAAILAMPVVVLARDLDLGWAREFALLEVLAMGAVLIAAGPLRPSREDRDLLRWLIAGLVGFAAATVAILAILLATGPSLADAYDGIVRQALGIRDVLLSQPPFPARSALTWAILAPAAAFLLTRVLRGQDGRPALWTALLRGLAGLAIWLGIAHIVVVGLNPSSGNPVIVPMLLAWIAVIPPAGAVESPHKRFLRVLLPALAVAETLQIYPVPGSQLGIASVCFVAVGAICLGDALTESRAALATTAERRERFRGAAAVAAVTLAAIFALNAIVLPGASSVVTYRDQQRLALPGAELMRLPAPTAVMYEELVDLLHRNECTTFIGLPNQDSLYLWSGLPAPAPQPPNAWVNALNEDQQRLAVEELRSSQRPCAIVNEEVAATYRGGGAPADKPLLGYVLEEFQPRSSVGNLEFMLPRPSATDAGR